MDMSEHVAPKSDQLDAEDLRSGPRDVTVAAVTRGPSEEQPINFHLEEIDRPWRPTKTVRRLIMAAWGTDTDTYVGRRLRIFRDPKVTFGGMAVGGIRVSHMSHLPNNVPLRPIIMIGRARSDEFVIHPLPDEAPQGGASSGGITPDHEAIIGAQMQRAGVSKDRVMELAEQAAGRKVAKSRELSSVEADALIVLLTELPDAEG
jgi:hypothetical protein